MTYIVGLTGGIGSGKSTLTKAFKDLGAPIIDADVIAKDATVPGTSFYQDIITRFGQSIVDQDQAIHRQKLREIIFQFQTEKQWLEALLHPYIRTQIDNKIKQVNFPYCIVVIPLLAENFGQYQSLLHYVINVDATVEKQIANASARDQASEEQIKAIIALQATREQRNAIADKIILNDADIATLEAQAQPLHLQFMSALKSI